MTCSIAERLYFEVHQPLEGRHGESDRTGSDCAENHHLNRFLFLRLKMLAAVEGTGNYWIASEHIGGCDASFLEDSPLQHPQSARKANPWEFNRVALDSEFQTVCCTSSLPVMSTPDSESLVAKN